MGFIRKINSAERKAKIDFPWRERYYYIRIVMTVSPEDDEMKLAAMSDQPNMFGTVPDTFETSPYMVIWDTDKSGGVAEVYPLSTPAEYARILKEQDCEAVVCGEHIGKEAFNAIAGACITRFKGTGQRIYDAVRGAFFNTLPIIPEYEGGPGCTSGHGSCEDGHCEG